MPNACWLTLTPTCACRVGCLGAVLARFEDLPRDRWLDRDGTAEAVRDVGSCPRVGPEAAVLGHLLPRSGLPRNQTVGWDGVAVRCPRRPPKGRALTWSGHRATR